MGMAVGYLLRNGQIERLDDSPKQHVHRCRFWHSCVNATAEDLDQSKVGARRVRQYLGLGHDAVQFIEQDQSTQVLNGIGVPSRPGSHCVTRLRTEGNEDVRDHQVKRCRMEDLYGFFDGRDDNDLCTQRFRHSTLHHIHMLRVIVNE